mmetsp:Transcript_5585/g.8511  ORF Transcript_5585/g.8511 Transcript_5585/m.8511 type:complete len:175 (+) Transcript_5585:72-596(+)
MIMKQAIFTISRHLTYACRSQHIYKRLLHCGSRAYNMPPLLIPRYTTQLFSSLTVNSFHKIADTTLDDIMDMLTVIEDSVDNADIVYAQGVLNINLGEKGCWVINKQTPNRQLWWSSPISGPRRYEYYDDDSGQGWYMSRAFENRAPEKELVYALRTEMLDATGIDILSMDIDE